MFDDDEAIARGMEEALRRSELDAAYARNLRFYASLFRKHEWGTDVLHWSVFEATLKEIADRLEESE